MGFLPKNYEAPSSSSYIKIGAGESYRLRILGNFEQPKTAVMGWEGWNANRHERFPFTDEGKAAAEAFDERSYARHFWALVVWDAEEKEIKTWVITQKTIHEMLIDIANNDKWGAPDRYVIQVSRTGSGMTDTKYSITPEPPIEAPLPILYEFMRDANIDLNNLFKKEEETEDIPF